MSTDTTSLSMADSAKVGDLFTFDGRATIDPVYHVEPDEVFSVVSVTDKYFVGMSVYRRGALALIPREWVRMIGSRAVYIEALVARAVGGVSIERDEQPDWEWAFNHLHRASQIARYMLEQEARRGS